MAYDLTGLYMKGFNEGRDAEAKEAASRIEHWMKLEAKAMAEIDDLRAQLECAKSDVAELRQQLATAEARAREAEEYLRQSRHYLKFALTVSEGNCGIQSTAEDRVGLAALIVNIDGILARAALATEQPK